MPWSQPNDATSQALSTNLGLGIDEGLAAHPMAGEEVAG